MWCEREAREQEVGRMLMCLICAVLQCLHRNKGSKSQKLLSVVVWESHSNPCERPVSP